MKPRSALLLSTLFAAVFATACDDGVSVQEAEPALGSEATTIRILLTDAPSDYIGAAEVDIGRVEILPTDGPPIVLSEDGTDGYVNLLDLQGPATMPIAEAEIDPGSFVQLRLIVDSARVTLADDLHFRDGSTQMDLFVPSGMQTGIKLNLRSADGDGPLEIVPGETVLVLDFDVNRSFVLRGNPETRAGVHGVNFTPTIRVTGQDVAASISGTVRTDVEGVSVEGLVVTAEPTDGGSVAGYQSEAGTALTDEEGNYTIHFLVPGSYDVTVGLDDPGLGSEPTNVPVVLENNENEIGVDFEIIDITGSISGTVSTTREETTIEGLTVTAISDGSSPDTLTTTVQADSTYSFDPVLPGDYTVTVAVGEDLLTVPGFREVSVGESQDVVDVDFEVIEDVSGSISGTVTTDLEVSVVGLTVTADPDDPEADPVMTTTVEGGAYSFPSLPAGDYTISVEAPDGFAVTPESTPVELEEDGVETEIDFEVVAAGS